MKKIHLNEEQSLSAESAGKKMRLIVSENGVENVCRLETIKNLKNFAVLTSGNLFKGRLQLHKNGPVVQIVVKGEIVGVISEESFKNLLV